MLINFFFIFFSPILAPYKSGAGAQGTLAFLSYPTVQCTCGGFGKPRRFFGSTATFLDKRRIFLCRRRLFAYQWLIFKAMANFPASMATFSRHAVGLVNQSEFFGCTVTFARPTATFRRTLLVNSQSYDLLFPLRRRQFVFLS